MEQINEYPTYWKNKDGSVLIWRMGKDHGAEIYMPQESIKTTHYGSKELMEQRLSSFSQIPEEEFEGMTNLKKS